MNTSLFRAKLCFDPNRRRQYEDFSRREPFSTGGKVILGEASWDTPHGNYEAEMARMAAGCAALAGTSIRSSPITKRIMESSNTLRIVVKYAIGVHDMDVEATTDLGILVAHAPTKSNWGGVAEGAITCSVLAS